MARRDSDDDPAPARPRSSTSFSVLLISLIAFLLFGYLTSELGRRREDVKQLQETVKKREQQIAELGQQQEERKLLQEMVKKREQQIIELEMQKKELLDKYVRKYVRDGSHSYIKDLEEQPVGAPSAGGTNALKPPDDVKGVILDTDPRNGLVTLSIGSDSGISKGNVLEVYRLKPEPKYLGQVRILEVNHHESAGRPIMAQRALSIQKGDTVASDILGQR